MKNVLRVCAVVLIFSLLCCGCGKNDQPSAEPTDAPTTQAPAENKVATMQVNLDGETYEITDADSVTEIYETLDGFLYEAADDTSVEGISLYFYDKHGNQFKAYTLGGDAVNVDGETYRITDDDDNYRELVDEVERMIVN